MTHEVHPGGMGQFGAAVSAMKCEMYFPLEYHQFAKVRTAVVKRVGVRFGLALVPDLSKYAVFISIIFNSCE